MKTVTLSQNILDILENNGFDTENLEFGKQDESFFIELNQCTPEGEDWWITIWSDGTDAGFIKNIIERADNFDIDEEVEPWIELRGEQGVPNSIVALIDDARWKQTTLRALADDLAVLTQ